MINLKNLLWSLWSLYNDKGLFLQELEEEEGSIMVEEEKLVNTKKAMHAKCKQLTQRCQSQEKEIERLKTKLQKMAEEVLCIAVYTYYKSVLLYLIKTLQRTIDISLQEDKRANRQSQVFQEFKKRTARAHSVMDEK